MKWILVILYSNGMSYYNISAPENVNVSFVKLLCQGLKLNLSTLAHSKLTIGPLRKVLPASILLSTVNLLCLYCYVFHYIINMNVFICVTEFNIFAPT